MTQPVIIVPVGPFGDPVAEHLATLRFDTVRTSLEDASDSAGPSWRIAVVAAWRPVVALCTAVDTMSRRLNRPFIPLVMEGATLSIGPTGTANHAGCWRCWIKRRNQHDPYASMRAAVTRFYDTSPEVGPQGYFEAAALIGAAQLSRIIDAIDATACVGGAVWQFDVLTRDVTASTVIGVDDCPYCGLGRSLEDRTYRAFQTLFAGADVTERQPAR